MHRKHDGRPVGEPSEARQRPWRTPARRRARAGAASRGCTSRAQRRARPMIVDRCDRRLHADERVDHRVADEEDAARGRRPRDAGCPSASGLWVKHQRESWSVRTRLISSGIVRSKLRSPASRCAIGNAELRGRERAGERRVDVARDDERDGTHVVEDLLDPLERPSRLRAVAARSDAELVVRRADARARRRRSRTSRGRSAGRC